MIRVTIEVEHYDGSIEVVRDDTLAQNMIAESGPVKALQNIVAAAEGSAIAAMSAHPEQPEALLR